MIRISVTAAIICFLVIQSVAGRGTRSGSLGKGKYYLVKTKDSSDLKPMAPEEDHDAAEVPDHTVPPGEQETPQSDDELENHTRVIFS